MVRPVRSYGAERLMTATENNRVPRTLLPQVVEELGGNVAYLEEVTARFHGRLGAYMRAPCEKATSCTKDPVPTMAADQIPEGIKKLAALSSQVRKLVDALSDDLERLEI